MCKTAVIICNGAFPRTEYPRYLISSADIKICCDGALQTLEKHSIEPDVVIGDLDSVCGRALRRFKGTVVKDSDQETNDLTKAFRYIMSHCSGIECIHILAATGKREDHTLGNMSLLMEYEKEYGLFGRGVSVDMVSDYSTAFAINGSCTLHVGEGRSVSIFCSDPSVRIHSEGLVWPTDNVVFDNWWKATLNKAAGDEVSLSFNHPCPALVVLD